MAWTFRFLEEIALADIGFEAEGESIEEVFRGATQALLESMATPSTVAGEWERAIELTRCGSVGAVVRLVVGGGLLEGRRRGGLSGGAAYSHA